MTLERRAGFRPSTIMLTRRLPEHSMFEGFATDVPDRRPGTVPSMAIVLLRTKA